MITENIEAILKDAGRYVEVKSEILTLKASDKAAETGSALVSALVISVVLLLGLLLLSVGIGFWLGKMLGEVYYGFFIVAGFYFLVGLILYFSRDSLIKTPLYNSIINKLTR